MNKDAISKANEMPKQPELQAAIAEQQALLKVILSPKAGDSFEGYDFDGIRLEPYRRGLKANAARALEVTFPTVHTLIGAQNFETLAAEYLQYDPPTAGDWGLWGAQLSTFLPTIDALKDYPFLGDCAALDWQCHVAEREQDQQLKAESLALLEQAPDSIYLLLGMGLKVIHSNFPIIDIYRAHQGESDTDWMAQAREKLSTGQGQTALVWRQKWKALVEPCDDTLAQWFTLLENHHSLGRCLDEMEKTDFAFENWLPLAIEKGWVLGLTQK